MVQGVAKSGSDRVEKLKVPPLKRLSAPAAPYAQISKVAGRGKGMKIHPVVQPVLRQKVIVEFGAQKSFAGHDLIHMSGPPTHTEAGRDRVDILKMLLISGQIAGIHI